jgi:hypothetical protein
MARPRQFQYPESDSLAVAKVKAALKELSPQGRAFVLAGLAKFYRDDGQMFSPSVSTSERRRVVIDSETFWLVKVPTK